MDLKRSGSLSKGLLKRRPSKSDKSQVEPDKSDNLPWTPASAYARAYAQRTHMFSGRSEQSESEVDTVAGRVDDDAEDGVLGLTRKVSARFRRRKISNPGPGLKHDDEPELSRGRSQSRPKDHLSKRDRALMEAGALARRDWEAGQEDWSREKERIGLRGIGLSNIALASASNSRYTPPASHSTTIPSPPTHDHAMRLGINRNRMSRHLSIEDFRSLVRIEYEMGATFEMWDPKTGRAGAPKPDDDRESDRPKERRRLESITRRGRSHRDHTVARERALEKQAATLGRSMTLGASRRDTRMTQHESQPAARKDDDILRRRTTIFRSDSASSEACSPLAEGSMSPESQKGGKFWRLVRKMSTGTLKEKKNVNVGCLVIGARLDLTDLVVQAEKAPPVPPLPPSRRSSVLDSPEESRRMSIGRSVCETASATPSIHSGPSSLSGHGTTTTPKQSQSQIHRHPSASGGRPSMTNDSSVVSSSPKSSFGRMHSPRTSMSSYVDLSDDIPPLPLGKHIVSPVELAQQYIPPIMYREREPLGNSGVGASPSLPPPKRPRAAQRPRGEPSTPLASPLLSPQDAVPRPKPRPNVLRRPTRLNDGTLGVPLRSGSASPRSPRSASMGMPSPRLRPLAQQEPVPRPRSNSLGTVFTFRELDNAQGRSKLTEQEKVAKFEQLLEASDKAGGTLHARVQDRLLSETLRMSETYDGSSVSGI